jgi:hypothetical protein
VKVVLKTSGSKHLDIGVAFVRLATSTYWIPRGLTA